MPRLPVSLAYGTTTAPTPPVKTLQQLMADQCAGQNFHRAVFRTTLYRHAVLFAPLLHWTGYFAVDHQLIAACGGARSMTEIQECILDYVHHPRNVGFLRRVIRIRVSARRVRRVARRFFGANDDEARRSAEWESTAPFPRV